MKILVSDGNFCELECIELLQLNSTFLNRRNRLKKVSFPNVIYASDFCLSLSENITDINFPNLERTGSHFLYNSKKIKTVILPSLKKLGEYSFCDSPLLGHLELPNIEIIEIFCFNWTESIPMDNILMNKGCKIKHGVFQHNPEFNLKIQEQHIL